MFLFQCLIFRCWITWRSSADGLGCQFALLDVARDPYFACGWGHFGYTRRMGGEIFAPCGEKQFCPWMFSAGSRPRSVFVGFSSTSITKVL